MILTYVMIGVGVGLISLLVQVIAYLIIEHMDKVDFDSYRKWMDDPTTEEFIYDSNGGKIWSNKKGCIGTATNIVKKG